MTFATTTTRKKLNIRTQIHRENANQDNKVRQLLVEKETFRYKNALQTKLLYGI